MTEPKKPRAKKAPAAPADATYSGRGPMSDAYIATLLGASGVRYYCRCGAESKKAHEARLMEHESWSLEYVEVVVLEPGKTTRSDRNITKSLTVFLCPVCVAAKREARAKKEAEKHGTVRH